MRSVVGAVHDDSVVGNTQLINLVEYGADIFVVIDHRIVIITLPTSGLTDAFGFGMGAKVHVREIHPNKHWLTVLDLFFYKLGSAGGGIIINNLHTLFG